MLTVFLYLSYFLVLFLFFIFVFFRIYFFAALMMYTLITWICTMPFIVFYIAAKKYEMDKTKSQK